MEDILKKYQEMVDTPSDINENLHILRELSSKCNHVTEFGVRWVVSTWAMLAGAPKRMISYDINYHINIELAKYLAKDAGIDFEFNVRNVLDPGLDIEQTDLLFIDTLHTYPQLVLELQKHSNKVNKYIAFHDTETYGYSNEFGIFSQPAGLMPAILSFVQENPVWHIIIKKTNNNGFLVLEQKYGVSS